MSLAINYPVSCVGSLDYSLWAKNTRNKNRLPIFGSKNRGHLRANVADYADRKNKYAFQI